MSAAYKFDARDIPVGDQLPGVIGRAKTQPRCEHLAMHILQGSRRRQRCSRYARQHVLGLNVCNFHAGYMRRQLGEQEGQ